MTKERERETTFTLYDRLFISRPNCIPKIIIEKGKEKKRFLNVVAASTLNYLRRIGFGRWQGERETDRRGRKAVEPFERDKIKKKRSKNQIKI